MSYKNIDKQHVVPLSEIEVVDTHGREAAQDDDIKEDDEFVDRVKSLASTGDVEVSVQESINFDIHKQRVKSPPRPSITAHSLQAIKIPPAKAVVDSNGGVIFKLYELNENSLSASCELESGFNVVKVVRIYLYNCILSSTLSLSE